MRGAPALLPTQIERDEHLEIPPEALREAILNALVHRQYTKNGSVSLAIYDDRLEVTSPGGFPPGKTVEQIISEHESEPRNPQIAHVLYLRKTIETWGRGFGRIRSECQKEGVPPPAIAEKDGYVRLTFVRVQKVIHNTVQFSRNTMQLSQKTCTETQDVGKENGQQCPKVALKRKVVSQMLDVVLPSLRRDARENAEKILLEIALNVHVTISAIAQRVGVSRRTVNNSITLLKEVGILFRIGGDRGGHWMISWKDKEK